MTIEVDAGVESLVGAWRTITVPDLYVDGERITKRALLFSLVAPDGSTEITKTVTSTLPWPNSLGSEVRNVVIPIKVEILSNAPVPSIWSGKLEGTIETASPAKGGKFVTSEEEASVSVTLHVATQDEVSAIYNEAGAAANTNTMRTILNYGLAVVILLVFGAILYYGEKLFRR